MLKKDEINKQLLLIVHTLMQELGATKAMRAIDTEAHLENDLGLDSLARAELFFRVETYYQIHLPESTLANVNTLSDLVNYIQQANPKNKFKIDEFSPILKQNSTLPLHATTIIEILHHYVIHCPDIPHFFIQDEYGDEIAITYQQLLDNATYLANGLTNHGIKSGDTVAIMLPTCADFFFAFIGILLAGGIPVPIYPPMRPQQIEHYIRQEANILNNAEVRVMIIFQDVARLSKLLQGFIPSLITVTTVKSLQMQSKSSSTLDISRHHGALIQYTSGSTGQPKGVLLTHANLLANIRAYGQALQISPTDVAVSWLPLYHDMGLIGAWMGSLYHGIPLTILSPLTFLLHPERWLWAIHYHRATLSAAPNFAYDLCVRRLDEEMLEGLDLSAWRCALNGAEAVHPKTLCSFSKKFSPYGFNIDALMPVYGLAENAVALCIPPLKRHFIIDKIEREQFLLAQKAIKIEKDELYYEFACCGSAIPGHQVRIVDDNGHCVVDRVIGEVQFNGPSAMQGYYHNIDATQAVYHNGWWSTGDYGYLANEEIYITGRKKDMIIKAGHNLSPEGPEEVAATVNGIRKGCVVAFGVTDSLSGTEKFVMVAETREKKTSEHQHIMVQINEKIAGMFGIPPDEIILTPPKTIPKTSSGKLQRSQCKQAYLEGKLNRKFAPVWIQLGKLLILNLWKTMIKQSKRLVSLVFAGYVILLLLLTAPVFWVVMMFSSQNLAAKVIRQYSRLLLRLCGCPLKVIGRDYLFAKQPVIFVANHSSYIDSMILHAILPDNVAFIGKKEILDMPFIKTIFIKLNYITVDRFDFIKSIQETEDIKQTLIGGRSIFIFPEGTFTYATGLRPFKLGAFKLAVDTMFPICPIAIKGARKRLRSGSYLPKPGPIEVTVTKLIQPHGNDLAEVNRLSQMTKSMFSKYSGEASIDLVVAGYEQREYE